jgi:AAA15 family ATPase/GTPase
MLERVKINNFRCFEALQINGLAHINLIAGQNNIGKTALLEAIYLMVQPSVSTINTILDLRQDSLENMRENLNTAWDNFFFAQNKINNIYFEIKTTDDKKYNTTLKYSESADIFVDYIEKTMTEKEHKLFKFAQRLKNEQLINAILSIETASDNHESLQKGVLIASADTVASRGARYTIIPAHFMTANTKMALSEMAKEASKLKLQSSDKWALFIKGLQTIDKDIIDVDIVTLGGGNLHLKKNNNISMPLAMYGDATYKIASIILLMLNNKNSIILIDEIENGIFHENQEKVWEMLFELALNPDFNAQIFATTHSAEMIKAFKNIVLKNNYNNKANYIKLEKHQDTNKIIAAKIPINFLDGAINQKIPYRGEKI